MAGEDDRGRGLGQDLDAQIARMRADDEAPMNPFPVWQRLQYLRDMASGRGVLTPLDNARYPQMVPATVRDVLTAPRRAS